MISLDALLMLLPIERNKNVTSNSQCNTKLLTPQAQAIMNPWSSVVLFREKCSRTVRSLQVECEYDGLAITETPSSHSA